MQKHIFAFDCMYVDLQCNTDAYVIRWVVCYTTSESSFATRFSHKN